MTPSRPARTLLTLATVAAAAAISACSATMPADPDLQAGRDDGPQLRALTRTWWSGPNPAATQRAAAPPDGVVAFDVDAGDTLPHFQAEMSIAVDPTDPRRAAVVSMSGSALGALTAASTIDGGLTWRQSTVPSVVTGGWVDADPMLAFDADGVLHLIHIPTGAAGPGPLGIEMTRSLDGGLTWEPNIRISANLGTDDKVAIAVDTGRGSPHRGNVYVAWKWPAQDILYTRSTDGGASYEEVRRIPSPPVSGPDLEVAPDGTVHLVANSASRRAIVHARSTDGGQTFSGLETVARTNIGFFTRPRAACQRFSLIQASIVADASGGPRHGSLYLVWNDHREPAACIDACDPQNPCDSDVVLSRSEDGGLTWSEPVTVHPDAPELSDQFHPWVALDPTDGAVYVAFKDTRDDPDRLLAHTYLARSTDGGRSWDRGWALSTGTGVAGSSFQFGDYQGLTASDGRIYAAWADFRNNPSVADLYVGVARYPTPRTRRVVAAAANAPGALGTVWTTSLELASTAEDAATVDLEWLPADGSPAATVTVEVPARGALRVDDVVGSVFGAAGAGAIEISAPPEVVAATRTFNRGGDGTYGQLVPAVDPATGVPAGGEARLLLLSESADRTVGARTNLGLVNLSHVTTTVAVSFETAGGAALGTVDLSLAPREMRQINRVLTRVTSADVADAVAVVIVGDTPGADAEPLVLAYASVVDNRTGDPTFVLPAERILTAGTFAAAASTDGALGTRWSSEAVLHNPGEEPATVRLALLASGGPNPDPATVPLELSPGEVRRIGDLLGDVFATDGAGAVRVVVDSGEVMGSSRTFNTSTEGTFGQGIPLVADHRALDAGRVARLIHLSRSADRGRGFRTNLGLVNLGTTATTFAIELSDADGTILGSLSVTLGPGEHRQLNDVLKSMSAGDIDDAVASVRVTDGFGRWLAYASVVDNRTGDPVFIAGS